MFNSLIADNCKSGEMKNSGDREGDNGGGGIYRRARDCGEHSGEHCYKYRYRDNVH